MKATYLLLLIMAVTVMSCRTKDGEPGPAGESGLSRQGSIAGKLTYVDSDGKPLEQSFSYEYYESLTDAYVTEYDDEYTIRFSRRDLKDTDKRFEFRIDGSIDQNGHFTTPEEGGLRFSYLNVTNNNLFSFHIDGGEGYYAPFYDDSESGTTSDITNFSFDIATGRLIFDYKIICDPDYINYEDRFNNTTSPAIDGHVDVIVLNKKEQVSF